MAYTVRAFNLTEAKAHADRHAAVRDYLVSINENVEDWDGVETIEDVKAILGDLSRLDETVSPVDED